MFSSIVAYLRGDSLAASAARHLLAAASATFLLLTVLPALDLVLKNDYSVSDYKVLLFAGLNGALAAGVRVIIPLVKSLVSILQAD